MRLSIKQKTEKQMEHGLHYLEHYANDLLLYSPWIRDIIVNNLPYTVTGVESIINLIRCVENIVDKGIPGDIVECGVYMGGASRLIMETLEHLGDPRTVWMYDTYDGVPVPSTEEGVYNWDTEQYQNMREWFDSREYVVEGTGTSWCYTNLEDVQDNIASLNYSGEVKFIKGLVEDTIPEQGPQNISLLRLDVDLTEPTRHVLDNFYSRVSTHGHVVFDDYGFNPTLKESVDEFLQANGSPFLFRSNKTVYQLVK